MIAACAVPMEILWITGRNFGSDLCQTTQIEISNALKREGHNVTFLAPQMKNDNSEVNIGDLKIIQLNIINFPGLKSISFDRQVKKKLPQILAEHFIDVAICSWRGVLGAANCLDSANIPWILIDRGPPAYSGILGKLQWKYYDKAFNKGKTRASAIFTVSKGHSDFVKERFSLQKNPFVISAGASPSKFSSRNSDRIRSTGLIYHGRLDKARNILKLVEVGDSLTKRKLDFRMTLVGKGSELNKLNKLSQSRKWLTITPSVGSEEVPKILSSNHIGMLPMDSRLVWRTSSPLKLFEYCAAGLTIVGVNHEGHQLNEECEFLKLVPEENMVEHFSSTIEEIINNNEFEKYSIMARKYIEENCTWDHSIQSLKEVLDELVPDKSS